jgi:hypothetical protein
MMLDAQRLAGADLCRLGTGGVTLLLHHQKTPAPKIAIRIIPIMVSLSAQRIASRAMRTKIARITTPAMMKMVVNSIANQVARRLFVFIRVIRGSILAPFKNDPRIPRRNTKQELPFTFSGTSLSQLS